LTPSPIGSPSLSSTTSPRSIADAELDAPLRGQPGVALDHRVLHLDGAAYGVHDTAELDQSTVAGTLHHASVVHGDGGIDQVASAPVWWLSEI
jgi:hypothetical protein